jgi:two-component system sensor histidine kinase HydH
MSPPPTEHGVAAAWMAELEHFARVAVDVRAARVYFALAPLSIIGLLSPTWPRLTLLGIATIGLFVVSKTEPHRLARQGFSTRFVSENARILATLHAVIFLLTGGLMSPLLPIAVVFSFVVVLIVGPDPALRPYFLHQAAAFLVLVAAHTFGWITTLTPAWFTTDVGVPHLAVQGAAIVTLTAIASRVGLFTRQLFTGVFGRVADARSDLLEAHRAQAEELTALSGAIAHELKNPLASVKGLGGLLARDMPEGKPAERLAVLRHEVDRMQGVLEEFLTFSRPLVPLVASVTDLRALADDVATLHEGLARDRGQRITVEGVGAAKVDPRKTRQVLINLLQNALDASPNGATVAIRVCPGATIHIDDEGPGPDEALGERLFEAGVTTKPNGNGLGLTIARALARQQGGELTLTRRGPTGARATVTFGASS